VSDVAQWAADHLRLPAAVNVVRSEVLEIPVKPVPHGAGLQGMLGLPWRAGDEGWTILIVCVVVELSGGPSSRSKYPTQWPAQVEWSPGKFIPVERF